MICHFLLTRAFDSTDTQTPRLIYGFFNVSISLKRQCKYECVCVCGNINNVTWQSNLYKTDHGKTPSTSCRSDRDRWSIAAARNTCCSFHPRPTKVALFFVVELLRRCFFLLLLGGQCGGGAQRPACKSSRQRTTMYAKRWQASAMLGRIHRKMAGNSRRADCQC